MKCRSWTLVAIAFAAMALVSGCKGSHNQDSTDMRVFNAVVDAEPLDVLVNDTVQAAAVPVGGVSGYAEFGGGTSDVKVRSSTNQSVLADKSLSLGSGTNYTLALFGRRAAIANILLVDDTTDPSSGHFKVRALGLSSDAIVDIYVVSGDISAFPATLAGVAGGTASDYTEGTAGTYTIIFTTTGTKEILFQSQPQNLAAGAKLTVVVFPATSGKLLNAALLNAGSTTTGVFLTNAQGRVKAINAISDPASLNFKSDGNAILSNVPFGGSSSYVNLSAGAHNLAIENSGTPGTNLAALTQTVGAAADYTVLASGTLAAPQLTVFADNNQLPATGNAKVRFMNALSGSGTVDVLVNFAGEATGLAFKSVSDYFTLGPSTTYTISFATPGGVSIIATLTNVEIDAGAIYTFVLAGTTANPQLKLVRDR